MLCLLLSASEIQNDSHPANNWGILGFADNITQVKAYCGQSKTFYSAHNLMSRAVLLIAFRQ